MAQLAQRRGYWTGSHRGLGHFMWAKDELGMVSACGKLWRHPGLEPAPYSRECHDCAKQVPKIMDEFKQRWQKDLRK